MDVFVEYLLDVLLVVALAYAIWSSVSRKKCPECSCRPYSNHANFCHRCGAGRNGGERNQDSTYFEKNKILLRVHRIMFIFVIGMPLLWLFSVFDVAEAYTLMVVFALYAVLGAAVVVFFYRRLSRCPECNSFVMLHHEELHSYNYCETCGVHIDTQPAASQKPRGPRGL
jgi:hypothetical protein